MGESDRLPRLLRKLTGRVAKAAADGASASVKREKDILEVATGPHLPSADAAHGVTWQQISREPSSQHSGGSTRVVTGLGDDIDEIVAFSPTLTAMITRLRAEGWHVGRADTPREGARPMMVITPDSEKPQVLVAPLVNPGQTVGSLSSAVGQAHHLVDHPREVRRPEPDERWEDWRDAALAKHFDTDAEGYLAAARIAREMERANGPSITVPLGQDLRRLDDAVEAGDVDRDWAVAVLAEEIGNNSSVITPGITRREETEAALRTIWDLDPDDH
ncbi:MAG: hypothetical protein HOQ36_13705 [Nocardia sp.]|nr:hypothetical protein [Nocardia sp.]